ncbi:MAG: cupin domain-containing protein [Fusobacteriaceae bacterium]|jgi:mannose-6-phosphate isomerase-like protein (cupin superfamily)|nr:cupin domain-containing protein [Fusobacteriaceae bacterium]
MVRRKFWKLIFVATLIFGFGISVFGKAAKDSQVFLKENLETWDRENVAGGTGTLAGKFSFTRNNAEPSFVIKEIGWMTLKPGDSIGSHAHGDNEDAYVIVSGTGEFTGSDGKAVKVGPQDITIARPGQSHALKNTGTEPLVFLDVVSKSVELTEEQKKEVLEAKQYFPKEELFTWDRMDLGGGKGKLGGTFAFSRNDSKPSYTIYEMGWYTLGPGDSIGHHKHVDNDDAIILVVGEGEFSDTDNVITKVGPGAITIARPGQAHGLVNTGKETMLLFGAIAKEPPKK